MRRFLAGLVVAGTLLGGAGPALADHDYDDGGGGQNYEDQWSNEDRNRNRGRDRGAFSPDFDRSPVTIIICPPGTQYCGSDGGRGDEPPPDERI